MSCPSPRSFSITTIWAIRSNNMALKLAALLPHSPLLIPEIGKANHSFLEKTTAAYETIGKQLAELSVDTVVIITPHSTSSLDSFVLNVAPDMSADFRDFGFLAAANPTSGDAILADQIKNALRPDFAIELDSQANLEHGSGIPLYLLRKYVPEAKALILSAPSGRELEEQAAFGARLGGVISQRNKNIAVIASGDLSHRLKKKSPGGYSPKGAKFDNRLIELISDGPSGIDAILSTEKKLAEEAGECGLKPLALLLGILGGLDWEPEILAYQTDFGIGYLSVNFHLALSPSPEVAEPKLANGRSQS